MLDELIRHWYGLEATAAGVSTGWRGLDELYRVTPGELSIVTGVPNSGKSHWLDALAVRLADSAGWRIAFASFEKSVVRHAQNLIELAARQPMFDPRGLPSMPPDDFFAALDFVDRHFLLIRHPDMADEPPPPAALSSLGPALGGPEGGAQAAWGAGADGGGAEGGGKGEEEVEDWLAEARQPCTIDWVLGKATQAVQRYGIRGLVIDPYNELEQRRGSMSETEYVSSMLSKVKRWAQRYQVHVWLVAHPKSMEDWDGSPPSMYDISGSAHWYNKADMGIVVHRYTRVAMDAALRRRAASSRPSGKPLHFPWSEKETLIKVLKARNRTSGTQGDYTLLYDSAHCSFRDPREEG
ncbi:hypothetical protein Agub_g8508 [Astrephomene gubernaculifera]|uniref:SF4 helicase domain-containing protein n=1 Tax=Astrephomene gubernaculifera TaxID=47775 RepID=A0AAD3HN50_9CHLO|nr:hypothetical protein Agub_g8508 [Astrephomene gubernaculifera]